MAVFVFTGSDAIRCKVTIVGVALVVFFTCSNSDITAQCKTTIAGVVSTSVVFRINTKGSYKYETERGPERSCRINKQGS